MDIASRNFFSFVTESGSQYVFERTEPGRRLRFRTLDGGHVTRTGRVRTIVVHAGTA